MIPVIIAGYGAVPNSTSWCEFDKSSFVELLKKGPTSGRNLSPWKSVGCISTPLRNKRSDIFVTSWQKEFDADFQAMDWKVFTVAMAKKKKEKEKSEIKMNILGMN